MSVESTTWTPTAHINNTAYYEKRNREMRTTLLIYFLDTTVMENAYHMKYAVLKYT